MKKRELPVMMRKNVKSNFLLILAGSFLVLLAAFLFLIPLERTESNIDIMSVVMILSGFLFILSFSKNKRGYFRPGWILSQGFFQMLIGCLMLFTAVFQTENCMVIFAFWALFTSVTQLTASIQLRALEIKRWWWLFGFGMMNLLMSVYFFLDPIGEFISFLTSAAFQLLLVGIMAYMESITYSR